MAISDDKWNKAAQELAEVMIYMMKLDYALHPRDLDDLEEIVDLLQKKQIKKTDLRVISMQPLLF
jgi:predicted solute-binding protein